MNEQLAIRDQHRQRLAVVYIRQSTLRQVTEHVESQALQYQLVARARSLGWPDERIVTIDEDLGKSAVSSSGRTGFQRLFTDVGTGKVGLLLVTDVSRLARNCADWYQLLDMAALADVLVCDSGGLYNPRAYDDRLLLGVKGAFSEAQWYMMRQQMQAARLNKARRGELAQRLPVGYERLPNGEVRFWPDEQVQEAIGLVFRLFRQKLTVRGVLRQLLADGVQVPQQRRNLLGQWGVSWVQPAYRHVYQILKSPAYAGVYAYGQRQREHVPGQVGTTYGGRLPPAEWQVRLQEQWPGYITWAEWQTNQQHLAQNWQGTRFANPAQPGPNRGIHNEPFAQPGQVGKGRALLQGVVVCGHCGQRMRVRYRDKPAYVCETGYQQRLERRCQYVPYVHVDQAVAAAFLEVVQPAAVEAAMAAWAGLGEQRQALVRQWQQQLARAEYAVRLAQARYEQVDPGMRLVAAALERQWEEALQAQGRLQGEWEQVQAQQLPPLTGPDEGVLRQLAEALPGVWAAATTGWAERKRLLRLLVADVTLDSRQEPGVTQVSIRWRTGAVTQVGVARPRPGHPSQPVLLARVRALVAEGYGDEAMAVRLNEEGVVSSWQMKAEAGYVPGQAVAYWTAERVAHIRHRYKIRLHRGAGGWLAAERVAGELGVSVSVLLDWFRRGLLVGEQVRRGAPVWLQWDEGVRYRVSGAAPRQLPFLPETKPEMVVLGAAASHFQLTPEQFKAALKAGRFLTWRLEHGRQYRWYVQEKEPGSTEFADSLAK